MVCSKIYMTSRKESGINDYMVYRYTDIERKIKDFDFIKEMAEILYTAIEEFEI